ncbi:MAG: hypothetical protein QM640_09100, partial [Niabella sp.]
MDRMKRVFSDRTHYAVYRFRSSVIARDINEREFIKEVYNRKVKLFFLGIDSGLYMYHLFTVLFDFDPEHTPQYIRKIAYIFDEVVLLSDGAGTIRKVVNAEKLKKKWLITRDALQKNHTGTAITLYFNAVDELLSDHKKLCSFFSE